MQYVSSTPIQPCLPLFIHDLDGVGKFLCKVDTILRVVVSSAWHIVSISVNDGCSSLENEFLFQASWIGGEGGTCIWTQDCKCRKAHWSNGNWPAWTLILILPRNSHMTWQVSSPVWAYLLICKKKYLFCWFVLSLWGNAWKVLGNRVWALWVAGLHKSRFL